jgi:hypothetical protein
MRCVPKAERPEDATALIEPIYRCVDEANSCAPFSEGHVSFKAWSAVGGCLMPLLAGRFKEWEGADG